MTDYELSGQERTDDERRAEAEKFAMIVLSGDGGGYVNVHNVSRDDTDDAPDAHIHSVHVEDGQADGCSCPHAMYRDAHCKHQVAVENRPLVLSSATAAASTATTGKQVATDGGTRQVAPNTDTTDTEADDRQTGDSDDKRPQTDHWGHEVEQFDDEPVGTGEKSECQSCGARFEIAMIAVTADSSNRNWEEFYECQSCGAHGSFRFYGERDTREWTGRIAYPDE